MGAIKRKNIKFFFIILAIVSIPFIAFIALILFEWGSDAIKYNESQLLGSVNGDEISYSEYWEAVQLYVNNQRGTNGKEPSESEIDKIKDEVWRMLVMQKIIGQEIKELDIEVNDDDVENVMYKNPEDLPEDVKKVFYDSTGKFDLSMYQIAMNSTSHEVEIFKGQVKILVQKKLESDRLLAVIAKDVKLTDEELKSVPKMDEANKLLKEKKNLAFKNWYDSKKSKAIIVDNRKEFER